MQAGSQHGRNRTPLALFCFRCNESLATPFIVVAGQSLPAGTAHSCERPRPAILDRGYDSERGDGADCLSEVSRGSLRKTASTAEVTSVATKKYRAA